MADSSGAFQLPLHFSDSLTKDKDSQWAPLLEPLFGKIKASILRLHLCCSWIKKTVFVSQSAAAVSVLILSLQHKLQHQPAHLSTCQTLLKTTSMMQFCSTRQFIRSKSMPLPSLRTPRSHWGPHSPRWSNLRQRENTCPALSRVGGTDGPTQKLRRCTYASSANGAFHHHISEQSEDPRDGLVCGHAVPADWSENCSAAGSVMCQISTFLSVTFHKKAIKITKSKVSGKN